jgi:hypothetical protein
VPWNRMTFSSGITGWLVGHDRTRGAPFIAPGEAPAVQAWATYSNGTSGFPPAQNLSEMIHGSCRSPLPWRLATSPSRGPVRA